MRHISKNRKGTKLKFCIRNGSMPMTHAKCQFKLIDGKFDFWDAGLSPNLELVRRVLLWIYPILSHSLLITLDTSWRVRHLPL